MSRLGRFGVAVAVLLAVALVVGGFVLYSKDRAAQREDFKADLAAVSVEFANVNPRWEDEEDGSTLEAVVTIAGCDVELARAGGEKTVINTVSDRKIEQYTVDEVNYKGREYHTDDYPVVMAKTSIFMATPTDIKTYLTDRGAKRFPCLNAAA